MPPPRQHQQQQDSDDDTNKGSTQSFQSIGSASNGDQRVPSNNGHHQRQQSQTRRPNQSTGRPMMVAGPSSQQHQQHHQSQQYRGSVSTPNRHTGTPSQPTPLFERFVTEEVQELKTYQRMVENQNRRLVELERIHGDLELRLEVESRGKAQLEATLEQREREWALRFRGLQEDRDHWKSEVGKEKEKNTKLLDQVVRKDQDIHRMLQRKYDNQRDSTTGQSIRANRLHAASSERPGTPERERQEGTPPQQFNKSPHEILAASGSMETVRIRNVQNLLNDFFSG